MDWGGKCCPAALRLPLSAPGGGQGVQTPRTRASMAGPQGGSQGPAQHRFTRRTRPSGESWGWRGQITSSAHVGVCGRTEKTTPGRMRTQSPTPRIPIFCDPSLCPLTFSSPPVTPRGSWFSCPPPSVSPRGTEPPSSLQGGPCTGPRLADPRAPGSLDAVSLFREWKCTWKKGVRHLYFIRNITTHLVLSAGSSGNTCSDFPPWSQVRRKNCVE